MLKMAIVEDYRMRENSRVVSLAKTVYDCDKESPYYRNSLEYINPDLQIRIQRPTANGRPLENPKHSTKNRYFQELNPWYVPYQSKGGKQSTKSIKQPDGCSPNIADEDDVLVFESRFESGNLKRAIQLDKNEYELVLKPDHNTKNYTQWFYFRMSNTRKYREYIFHIINFVKPDS